MDWEIFTLGGGELHNQIFNGVAAMMGHGSYSKLLALAMLCGLIGMLVRCAYRGSLLDWQWMIWAILGFYAAFVPVANVLITDELDPSQSSVVGNVPLGLAATAGISNEVGHWLAQTTEAVFSLPDDITYSRHGMLFGNKLLDAVTRFEVTDARTAGNLSEFWQQCVFYDLLLGLYSIEDLNSSPDVWGFIKGHTSMARAFSYRGPGGRPSIENCRDEANGPLNEDLNLEVRRLKDFHGFQLVRAPTASSAVSQFVTAMPVAYQYMTGLSDGASQIILQTTLANSMQRGIADWAARVDAPAAIQDYAVARAEAERRSTYAVLGALAQKYLPVILDIIQASIYAIFPVAFILMLMPGGHRAVIAYLKVLAWLTLWPVLYAILNLGMVIFTRIATAPAITLPDGTQALTLSNYTGVGHVMSDYSLFCGYLMLSIPVLAYYLVDAGGAVLASAAQGIVASYEKPASQAAGEASGGNVSLGNLSVENSRMFQSQSAPTDEMGAMHFSGPDGRRMTFTTFGSYADMLQSNMPIKANLGSSVTRITSLLESSELAKTSERSAQHGDQFQATLSSINNLVDQVRSDSGYASQFSKNDTSSLVQNFEKTMQHLNAFAKENRLSDAQAASIVGSVAAGLQGDNLPVIKASIGGVMQGSSEARLERLVNEAQRVIHETGLGSSLKQTIEGARQTLATYSGSHSLQDATGLESSVQKFSTSQSLLGESLRNARRTVTTNERAKAASFVMDANANDLIRNFVANNFLNGDISAYDRLQQEAALGNEAAWQFLEHCRNIFVNGAAARLADLQADSNDGPFVNAGAGSIETLSAEGKKLVEKNGREFSATVYTQAGVERVGDSESIAERVESAKVSADASFSDIQNQRKSGSASLETEDSSRAGAINRELDEAAAQSLTGRAGGGLKASVLSLTGKALPRSSADAKGSAEAGKK